MKSFDLQANAISKLLFENAILLLVLLVAIQFVIIAIWSRVRSRYWARTVWVGFALLVALPLLSSLVATPRERVIGLCRKLAHLVDRGDVDAIAPHLAETFRVEHLGKSEFLVRAEQRLSHYRVDNPSLRHFETVFPSDGAAEVVFDATCTVRSVDQFAGRLPSRWRVRMVEEDGRWRLLEVEALPTPLSPIRDLRDWLP
jgi:hypothetical protein